MTSFCGARALTPGPAVPGSPVMRSPMSARTRARAMRPVLPPHRPSGLGLDLPPPSMRQHPGRRVAHATQPAAAPARPSGVAGQAVRACVSGSSGGRCWMQ